jgi:hypothetical protein
MANIPQPTLRPNSTPNPAAGRVSQVPSTNKPVIYGDAQVSTDGQALEAESVVRA